MAKKKILKITPILITLNILLLIVITSFYTFRLVKYYKLEHQNSPTGIVKLSSEIIKNQTYLNTTNGLIFDENTKTYIYKGKVSNNYLLYSGNLYRILSVDKNNNVKLVSEKNLSIIYSGLEKGFEKSYINNWLNIGDSKNSGKFEKSLYNSDKLLTNTYMCNDTVDDLKNIKCENNTNNYKITLMSLYDYKTAGGNNSFLNNGCSYYLSTLDSNNNNYYVNKNGEIGLNKITTKMYGIRPVITIKGDSELLNGDGSIDNPYIIEEHNIKTLNNTYVGNIISFNNNIYKVVEVNNEKVKIVLNGVLKQNDTDLKISFDNYSNKFDLNTNIGKYLNNDFLNSIKDNQKIVSSDWGIGKLSLDNLDYLSTYNETVNAKIGMLSLGDFYVNDYINTFTLSRGIEGNNIIEVINNDGNIYGDLITSKYNVSPSFYLNGNIEIIGGIGSELGPYELGDVNEEEAK